MRNSSITRMNLAFASILGLGRALASRALDFSPGASPGGSKKYPFSSSRQDRRTARSQISIPMPNGHTVMQTLPKHFRRTEREVDIILGASA